MLSLLKPKAYKSAGLDAGGDWAFQFHPSNGFFCIAVVSGYCWISVNAIQPPVQLKAGEFAVLPQAPAFCVASDPTVPPVDFLSTITGPLRGGIVKWQGGGDCLLLSAFFTFGSEHSNLLSEVLPSIVHLNAASDCAALKWYLGRMMTVIRDARPGSVLQGEYLAQMMLIEVLYLYAANTMTRRVGWLSALADKQLGAAMVAMHEDPGHPWTVQELAERAGMSRSGFAMKFRKQAGVAVMEYLIRWRMLLAADRLSSSADSVSTVALSLGYESESAFGFAFKREMGSSPRQYCRKRAPGSATPAPTNPQKEGGDLCHVQAGLEEAVDRSKGYGVGLGL